MKKILCFAVALALFLCGCGGDVSQCGRTRGPSEQYNQREIDLAMDVVEKHFRREFGGCTLLVMKFFESENGEKAAQWAANCGTDEAIVILGDFSVDEDYKKGNLEPGETYRNFRWVLTRNEGEEWVLQICGYV